MHVQPDLPLPPEEAVDRRLLGAQEVVDAAEVGHKVVARNLQ